MPYEKQTWADRVEGGTKITAERLNHMEAGIADAHAVAATGGDGATAAKNAAAAADAKATQVASSLEALTARVKTLETSSGSGGSTNVVVGAGDCGAVYKIGTLVFFTLQAQLKNSASLGTIPAGFRPTSKSLLQSVSIIRGNFGDSQAAPTAATVDTNGAVVGIGDDWKLYSNEYLVFGFGIWHTAK